MLPVPMFNVVNGGAYAWGRMEIQEFLLIPVGAPTYAEAQRMGVEIFTALGERIEREYGKDRVGGGSYAGHAAFTDDPARILDAILRAAEAAGYGSQCRLGLDCAASQFHDARSGRYRFRGREVGRDELIRCLESLCASYRLLVLEDPLDEDDFEGHADITKRVGSLVVGDDLFVTNLARLRRGVEMGAARAMILKPNMVGTISEAMAAARYATERDYVVIGSCRAGGSVDDPIPDVSVAAGASLVKLGAPRTGERVAMQNGLLRIEEEMGDAAVFAGPRFARQA
jgi:enolase